MKGFIIFVLLTMFTLMVALSLNIRSLHKRVAFTESIMTYENIGKFEQREKRISDLEKLHYGVEGFNPPGKPE